MVRLQHVVITLFNLKGYEFDKSNHSVCTDEWLQNRFQLFERFCLPSMQQQTTSKYFWLCLFDIDTLRFRERIDAYREQVPQFTPCYLNGEESFHWREYVVQRILEYSSPDVEFVITTNLDNDDCLHCKALERIQQAVQRERCAGLYVFPCGYQYFEQSHMMLQMYYPHNHFMSLCEKYAPSIKTVKWGSHGSMRRKVDFVCDMDELPYWIEVVHARNVANDIRVTSRIRYSLPQNATDWSTYAPGAFGALRCRWSSIVLFTGLFLKASIRKLWRKVQFSFVKD